MKLLRKKDPVETAIEEQQIEQEKNIRVEFLDSGIDTLNIIMSGKVIGGGFPRGRISNIVGDGSSGKTAIWLELAYQLFLDFKNNFAKLNASTIYPKVKKLRIVANNTEGVMDFPLEEMYGEEFVEFIKWIQTPTVEEMGRDVGREIADNQEGECLLYIIDSLDALTSEGGLKRFEDAAEKDKPEKDSFNTEKPKYLSMSFFNNLCAIMKGKDVTLIIISQVRENIGIQFGETKKRNGGKAMDFYTHNVVWLAVKEKISQTILGKKITTGVVIKAKVKRSKVTKPYKEEDFIILFDYGPDNIASSLAYLYGPEKKELEWNKKKYAREELIKYIEHNNLQTELAQKVESLWSKIAAKAAPNRLSRIVQ